jgi:hypothetical protein
MVFTVHLAHANNGRADCIRSATPTQLQVLIFSGLNGWEGLKLTRSQVALPAALGVHYVAHAHITMH